MATVTFDTHRYISRLKQGGVPEEQANAFASALADALATATDDLVTRDYLDAKLAELRGELRVEMHDMKADIIKWMAGLLILQAGVIAALVKLL
ncbi:MAG: DUF1640 domain-containing protein [Gammaproteobacteria bacterium]